jgi:hypothetical protein
MTDRTRLAERLEQQSHDLFNGQTAFLLREAAEWLTRGCETCRYCYKTCRVGEPKTRIDGCSRVNKPCVDLGNGCNAWEGRARP